MDTLVGRASELALLERALARAEAGERGLLMLSGEPGIGKTRLLEELAHRGIQRGFRVAWGRMLEVGLTPPFWPWLQVLAALGPDAPRLDDLERPSASARLARFHEVARFLERAAPVLVLLDDLHVADAASLQLLEYLLPLSETAHVLLAVALREEECGAELAQCVVRLQRRAQRLVLPRLDRAASSALVAGRADADRVFELSEGNPLFISELVASAQGDGALRLPPLSSVRDLILARVRALPVESTDAVFAAAVVGREFRAQVVAHMLEHDDVAARLAPLLALGLVTMTAPDRYRFSHALVAEALADELASSERARLHLRAAHARERFEPDDLAGIAHHLLAAGQLSALAAVDAAERAAARCLAQLAFEDAAALLERALAALALGAPQASLQRVRLLCARAEALQHAGRHVEAARSCDEAASLARQESPTWLARVALVRGLEWRFGHSDPLLIAVLREATDALGDREPALHAKLQARLAAAEQPALDPMQPVARALAAIAEGRTLAARDRLDVLYVATAALVEYHDPEALTALHREVLALARGVDPAIVVHTRWRLCFSALEHVERAAFDAEFAAFRSEAEALGLARWTRQVHMLEALTALLEGRFADAQCAAERSADGQPASAWSLDVHRVCAAWIATRSVSPELRRVGEAYAPGRAAIRAWFAVQDRDRDAARAALAELGGRVPLDTDLGSMVATATAFVGDRQRAEAVYGEMLRRKRVVLVSMVGSCVFDLHDRVLLVLAAAAGLRDRVEEHGRCALSVAERLGSPTWIAHVCADWADALPHDQARASALRERAAAIASRLDMPGLLARCTCSPGQASLEIVQEGELWRVRGFGSDARVKGSRGIEMLAKLVSEPDRPLHVLDLVGSALMEGDAGPLLDARARDAYRDRLRTLHACRDEAEQRGDLGALTAANQELEALSVELERAFGLGGRPRSAGSPSERARSNVQRRIRHAIEQVSAASPQLGERLATCIRTGVFCCYEPGRTPK
ncbi:MAG TPA: AAA family ATPase [Polyangiales bacterium]